ncbi:amidase family protein [Bradyrhizobium sp. OAE829]|uniref:amidase family protein n=1 Tax=Bradyrhizobium sp. OAE829 TaxID=2663807 RepID=UPI00178AF620
MIRRREFLAGAAASLVASTRPTTSSAEIQTSPDLSATAAIRAMQRGELKAEAYAGALLERARVHKALNAFITLDPEAVLEAARAADKKRQSGGPLALMHGLPIPIKDSMNTRVLPTSNGTKSLRNFKPANDAALVRRLLDQGAIVMGKTNMTELSFGWTSNNEAFGPVHNPYDPERIPGGSSGGAAAAVAARIAPLATAADTLGSIRVPAAMCGVSGLRPTYGRYPADGIMPLTTNKFDQGGCVARTVEDLALFDAVQTGETAPLPAKPLKGVRIGVPPFYMAGLDPEIAKTAEQTFRRLRDGGAVIVEAEIPDVLKSAFNVAATIMLYESHPTIAAYLEQQGTGINFDQMFSQVSEHLGQFFRKVAMPPGRPPKDAYDAMIAKREELKEAVRAHFNQQRIEVLAFPAIAALPPRIGVDGEVDIAGKNVSFFEAFGRNTSLGPVTGMPGLVLPMGLSEHGLPIAIEFEGLPGDDRNLLSLGMSIEKLLGPIPSPKA